MTPFGRPARSRGDRTIGAGLTLRADAHSAGRRALRLVQVVGAVLLLTGVITACAFSGSAQAGGTGPGASGNTIPGAAAAQQPFTPNEPFDSGQPIDVVVPANSVLTPGATIFVLECAAPNGVDPTTTASCDGNTGYAGGTISVNSDGALDVIKSSTGSGLPYIIYALPDQVTLGETPQGSPKCGLGAANECVLYIGQGGGNDVGMSQPHFFSQPFQVHPDATDSGTVNPGDGSPAAAASVSPTLSTVTPSTQNATADGTDPATVMVTLNDTNSTPVPGKTVSLAGTGQATVAPATTGSNVTDANGQATFTVTDANAETVSLHATDTTDTVAVTATAQVTFAPETVNLSVSTVTASPAQVPNDGTTASTVTVTLRDNSVHGSPAPMVGKSISLIGQGGSSVIAPASTGSDVTNSSGVATFSVTDLVNEAVTYQAADTTDSVTLTSTTAVTFGAALPVSATKSTLVANPTSAQTGTAGTEVTVTLLAADGTSPIIGKTVTLSVTGSASVVGGDTGTSDSSGQALFQVTDATPETVTISAADTTDSVTLTNTTSVTFSTPPPPTVSADLSTAVVSGSPAPADGQSEAVVNITIRNTNSQPVAGVAVTVSANPSSTTSVDPVQGGSGPPGTTDSQGQTSWGVRDTTAETVTLTVTASTVTLTTKPTAVFTAGSPDANKSTVAANPANVAADGTTASTVTVTLTDYFGNPIQGKAIALAPSGGHSVVTATAAGAGSTPGSTNAQGVATFAVTDATTEVVTYSANDSIDGLTLSQLASVTFGTPPPVLPTQGDSSAVVNDSKVVADGKTAAAITVTLRDANGAPVSGKTMSLAASAGSSVISAAPAASGSAAGAQGHAASPSPTVTTDSNGIATFDVTDTVPEAVTYTATDTTDSMSGWTVSVTFTAATATSTTAPPSTTGGASATAAGAGSSGAGTTGDSSAGSGSTDSGSAAADSSTPNLAFTGAPGALPWLLGLGGLFLLVGTLGRRANGARSRGR